MSPLPPLIDRYRGLLDDPEDFTSALMEPLPTDLRWNPFMVDREAFEAGLHREGATWKALPACPEGCRVEGLSGPGLTMAYRLGWYHPQGYTSMLAPRLLDPVPGSAVLDLCASPGGKTGQMAAMMEGRGVLVANDIDHRRTAVLASNLERLAVPNALLVTYRGENFPERFTFDHVLADVPCTGQGTYRVGAGRWHEDDGEALTSMPRLQERLLRKALTVVRTGGTVLYSTCSYAPEENEAVVGAVLDDGLAEVVTVPLEGPHGVLPARPGITAWQGRSFAAALADTLRFWPQDTRSWGFYCALLRRTG